ncbi:hypothetical protein MHYP_G00213880 [Metynnis hypsauchen]
MNSRLGRISGKCVFDAAMEKMLNYSLITNKVCPVGSSGTIACLILLWIAFLLQLLQLVLYALVLRRNRWNHIIFASIPELIQQYNGAVHERINQRFMEMIQSKSRWA